MSYRNEKKLPKLQWREAKITKKKSGKIFIHTRFILIEKQKKKRLTPPELTGFIDCCMHALHFVLYIEEIGATVDAVDRELK